MREYEKAAEIRLAEFKNRAVRMKAASAEAAPHIPESSLDFVFIDAIHTYEAVKQDIALWASKVRPAGLIAGHDYRWPGVQKAVLEFQEQSKYQGFFTPPSSDIWFFVKA